MCRQMNWFFPMLAIVVLTLGFPTLGGAQVVLYDNFNANQINPAKWIGLGGDPDLREVVRTLAPNPALPGDRRLRLFQRAYAQTSTDSGGSGNVFGLGFPQPASVTEVVFTVVVNKAQAVGCAANPSVESATAAEFRGRFFNTETSPTSVLGDIEAAVGAQRSATDAGTALTVVGFFQRCDDANCAARTTLGFNVLGSVNLGKPVALRIKWDQPNHQFIFQMNDQPEVVSPYTLSDTSPPFGVGKGIDLARGVPNCTTAPRPFAALDTFFDNVFVNR